MSDEDKGFLARWSQRKRDAGKAEPGDAATDKPAPQAAEPAPAPGEVEPPFDLESLPKLEELTRDTDMTVFFRKGVPESIRNAALRKSWALDPAIRNYVNPALDYAYDWNTPGGVPGAGELAPGTDIARMVAQVFGELPQAADEPVTTEHVGDAPFEMRQPAAASPLAGLSDATPPNPDYVAQRAAAADEVGAQHAEGQERDVAYAERRSFASQQEPRKHGSARPK